MKILKWIVIVIVAIIAIFLIYSAMQPNKAIVSETIEIKKPASVIYADISDFKTWSNWSVWAQMDPNMENEFSETMGEIGSFTAWKSDNPLVGIGRQEIIELRENEYLKFKMNFDAWPGTKYAEFIIEENEGVTNVTWTYEGTETAFYMNFMNSMIEKMLIPNYQDGLKNMKEYMESMTTEVANPMNLEVIEFEARKVISIKDSTDAMGISAKLGELYGELSVFMAMNEDLESAGMPLAFYHMYSEGKVILEAALPYSGEATAEGRINVTETPAGKVIKGVNLGSYESTEAMHYAIDDFIKASQLEYRGACWEVYANDPTTVEEAEIETQLFYPVK
jgi:effector-binding domain-containing protein